MFQDPINYIDNSGNFAIPLIIPLVPVLTNTALWGGLVVSGSLLVDQLIDAYSIKSGKEKASDLPSWARGKPALPGEKPTETADRFSKDKWGPGYPKGPGSDYNKIKKYFERKPKNGDC